jgi:hypothetical protein
VFPDPPGTVPVPPVPSNAPPPPDPLPPPEPPPERAGTQQAPRRRGRGPRQRQRRPLPRRRPSRPGDGGLPGSRHHPLPPCAAAAAPRQPRRGCARAAPCARPCSAQGGRVGGEGEGVRGHGKGPLAKALTCAMATYSGRPCHSDLCRSACARAASSCDEKHTKPKPREVPVAPSRITRADVMVPKGVNLERSSSSPTSSVRFFT